MSNLYSGIEIAMPTKHKKANTIEKAFNEYFDVKIKEVEVDTDVLGTFAGEVDRDDTPLNTAIKKLELVSGFDYVIASEGSIGNDSSLPFLISDVEILTFKDQRRDLVIKEVFRSFEITAAHKEIFPGEDISEFLEKADFPNHSIIVKPSNLKECPPIKGLRDIDSLNAAIREVAQHSKRITLESDFRANHSPSRMKNIFQTAQKLAKRIATLCRDCGTPGFGVSRYQKGVICSECKLMNPEAINREILSCIKCGAEELGSVINQELTPDRCIWCNP